MGKTGHRDTGIFQALFDFTDQVPGQVALAGTKDDGYRHGEGENEPCPVLFHEG